MVVPWKTLGWLIQKPKEKYKIHVITANEDKKYMAIFRTKF